MTKKQRYDLVCNAYTTMKKGDDTIAILDTDKLSAGDQAMFQKWQADLDVTFDRSYEIMADACNIISEKTLDGNYRDSLIGDDLDFFADADGRANVYTGVQLSYLNVYNQQEISEIFKDESQDNIAQACSSWYTQKVVDACETLKDFILNH
jgi:hypothetical protein